MWSEHCSYKSSKRYLQTLPTKGAAVVQGPGENAGVVDVGDGNVCVFKIESHNHPSYVEPHGGAATGVGGILRDIFTMGARPLASLDTLRFGPLDDPHQRYLVRGVVKGIGDYGNCFGCATVGGEVTFHPRYRKNILVNAMNVGIARADQIFLAKASGTGNPVIYVGSKTGSRRHPRREPAGVGRVRRGHRREAPDRAARRPVHREAAARGVPRGDEDRRDRRHPGHGRGGADLLELRDGVALGHRHRDGPRPGAAARDEHERVRAAALRVAGAHAARRRGRARAARSSTSSPSGTSTPRSSGASPTTAACACAGTARSWSTSPSIRSRRTRRSTTGPKAQPADFEARRTLDLAALPAESDPSGALLQLLASPEPLLPGVGVPPVRPARAGPDRAAAGRRRRGRAHPRDRARRSRSPPTATRAGARSIPTPARSTRWPRPRATWR